MDFIKFDSHHKVIDSIKINNNVVYLFDYMDFPKTSQTQNLKCYTKDGNFVWAAENPTDQIDDGYVDVSFNEKLKANSFSCFSVVLDIETGAILKKEFTK